MARRRRHSPEEYINDRGDKCDSIFEVMVTNDLIRRGVSFEHHPEPLEYHRPVRGGFCRDCDSNNVRKGALYQADLYLPIEDIYIELKGGSFTKDSRGRLVNVVQSGHKIHFLFRDDRKIAGLKSRHSEWAAKRKCPWHIGTRVPEEWLHADNK